MFTKQHYKAIADVIHGCHLDRVADSRKNLSVLSKRVLILRFADMFETERKEFNREQFIKACKGE